MLMFDAAYPPPVIGGKEKQAHLLTRELLNCQAKVKVVTFAHYENESGQYQGVDVRRLKRSMVAPVVLMVYLFRMRFVFDILHVHTPSRIGRGVAVFGAFLGYRVIFKFPNEHILDNCSWIDKVFWRLTLRMVRLVVVLENDTFRKLKAWGVKKERIFFVANGVQLGSRKEQRRKAKPLRLLFVGRLLPQKRCSDLIAACGVLRARRVDWKLDIVGDGPLKNDLQHLSRELGIDDRVVFRGHRDDVSRFMQEADVLIVPSEREGMSNVILEGMSIGIPIVASDVGSAKRMLGTEGRRYIFEPYDIKALAEKILLLADDDEGRERYSVYLFDRCRKYFSINSIAETYMVQYKRLTS